MFIRTLSRGLLFIILVNLSYAYAADNLASDPKVNAFIKQMVKKDNFDQAALQKIFSQVKIQQKVFDSISRPYEAKPWYQYRKLFVNQKRINGGVKFWNEHKKVLNRAEKTYGVPPEMVTAILGIETLYGQRQGSYRVIDALSTLAFRYPPRSRFFKKELRHYLLLTREHKLNPLKPLGSYAGAIGQPQFMPSSYRGYAVDFSGNGTSDLNNNTTDVIGSVANYFHRHGWKKGQQIAVRADVTGNQYKKLVKKRRSLNAKYSLKKLNKLGIKPKQALTRPLPANLMVLDGSKEEQQFWLGFPNFYVITRYNTSELYALAAVELSEAIKQAHNNSKSKNS